MPCRVQYSREGRQFIWLRELPLPERESFAAWLVEKRVPIPYINGEYDQEYALWPDFQRWQREK